MPRKKLFIVLLFAAAWSGYYVVFYKLSGLPFSWFSLLFTIAGTVSLAMCIVSVSKVRGFLLGLLALITIMIYGLVSFGFFTVFGNFDFTSSVGVPVAQMVPFAMDFARIIPVPLYLASAGMLLIYTVLFLYIRTDRRIMFQNTEAYSERVHRPFLIIITVLVFQIVPFSFAWYLFGHPLSSWWNARAKAADWGIIGNLYGRAAHAARERYVPSTSVLAQTEPLPAILTVQKTDTVTSSKSATPYDTERALLARLGPANSATHALYSALAPTVSVSSTPSTHPNIIVYQLESVPAWAMAPDSAMPFLYSLRQHTLTTHEFFANSCHTINAEFTSMCSMFAPVEGPVQPENVPEHTCLPSILHEQFGYTTSLYHANTMDFWKRTDIAPRMGYNRFVFTPHFPERAPDSMVLKEVVDMMTNTTTPQFAYVVGFTSHAPHVQEIMKDQERRFGLSIKPFEGPIDPAIVENSELKEPDLRNYMGFLRVIDDTIRGLFADLEQHHMLNNTIVVMYGDHRYYNFPALNADNWMRYNQIPFALWVPDASAQELKAIGSHLDVAPTLLNLVAEDDYRPPETMLGTSLLSLGSAAPFAMTTCHQHAEMYDGQRMVQGDTTTGVYARVERTGLPTPAGAVGGYLQAAVMGAQGLLGGK